MPAANGQSFLRRRYVRPLYTLLVVVGLVLLVACANIANLMLAHATARRHELSVRRALGASRLRLARQLLVESLVLSGAGALIGLLFARGGSQLLIRQLSTSTNTVFLDLSLDWRVLAFTMAAAILTTLVFGTPLLAGRDFDGGDRLGARPVAIVNDAFARNFLKGANPVVSTLVFGLPPRRSGDPRQRGRVPCPRRRDRRMAACTPRGAHRSG